MSTQDSLGGHRFNESQPLVANVGADFVRHVAGAPMLSLEIALDHTGLVKKNDVEAAFFKENVLQNWNKESLVFMGDGPSNLRLIADVPESKAECFRLLVISLTAHMQIRWQRSSKLFIGF